MPRKEHHLPVILSPAEVLRFLEAAPSYSHRVIFSTMYGTGMRVSEALHLRMGHIDSRRMMIRIEQAKGTVFQVAGRALIDRTVAAAHARAAQS